TCTDPATWATAICSHCASFRLPPAGVARLWEMCHTAHEWVGVWRTCGDAMVLQVDNVDRRFGANVACSAVSLSVDAGEIVALLGENGAGKSTLLSIIAGFVVPERGTVSVDGVPRPAGDPAAALRAGIG